MKKHGKLKILMLLLSTMGIGMSGVESTAGVLTEDAVVPRTPVVNQVQEFAGSLAPVNCYIESRPYGLLMDRPLTLVEICFKENIEMTPDAHAYVLCGDEKVAVAKFFKSENYKNGDSTQGNLYIYFSGECLPLGREYKLCVDPGSVCLSDDEKSTNDFISFPFEIPSDLGDASFDLTLGVDKNDEIIVVEDNCISCSWGFETEKVGNPEWELYREGELIRKYPVDVSCDWDLGTAYLHFGEYIHFEDKVNYSLRLPAGSVCTYRPEIVNLEEVLDFTGGYTGEIRRPEYRKCSLEDNAVGSVSVVDFHYSDAINVIAGHKVSLTETDGTESRQWSVEPTVREEGRWWILSADFGDVERRDGMTYTVEVPEGTVVTAKGDIAVNPTQTTSVGSSGVTVTESDGFLAWTDGLMLTVDGVAAGMTVTVYDSLGRTIRRIEAAPGRVETELPSPGLYLVTVGSQTRKLLVR